MEPFGWFFYVMIGSLLLAGAWKCIEASIELKEDLRRKCRLLKLDMSESQVKSTLGEPSKVEMQAPMCHWKYPGGATVTFTNGKLTGWNEP